MSEPDSPTKEEALRRISEPEGDHELHSVLERMRVHHPHLWEVLHRVHLSDEANPARLEDWRCLRDHRRKGRHLLDTATAIAFLHNLRIGMRDSS